MSIGDVKPGAYDQDKKHIGFHHVDDRFSQHLWIVPKKLDGVCFREGIPVEQVECAVNDAVDIRKQASDAQGCIDPQLALYKPSESILAWILPS